MDIYVITYFDLSRGFKRYKVSVYKDVLCKKLESFFNMPNIVVYSVTPTEIE